MSAIDNKHLIEIFATKVEGGVSKKTGNAWEMRKAQCLIKGPDGSMQVGVLALPRSMKDAPEPGKYLAEFELGIDFENRVIPLLTKLHPYGESGKSGSGPSAKGA